MYNLFGRIIHDAGRHGMLTMQEVFEKSSNIGAIQVGLKVGDHTMYDYVGKFGFGRKTGIELPGESTGMMRHVDDWTKTSIGSVAMGHEVSTTSLQLAVAGAVIANGGMLVKPTIVLSRQKPGQATERFVSEKPRSTIRPETAITMRRFSGKAWCCVHRKGLAGPAGLYVGRKNRDRAGLRLEGACLHASIQRELSRVCAGGESADRGRGDA